MKRIVAVLALLAVTVATPASAAAAGGQRSEAHAATAPRSADGPGYAYVHAAPTPASGPAGQGSARPGATPSASARSEAGAQPRQDAAGQATTTPAPPNTDFVFRFSPEVGAQKRAVFEAAAGYWSDVLEVEVPIDVDVGLASFDDAGILGGAAPTGLFANEESFPTLDVWYVSAQANQFFGADIEQSVPEIDVLVSADVTFYEGLDGQVPTNQIALLTLALHELAHGLGHTTLGRAFPDGTASIELDGLPLAFDTVIVDRSQTPITALGPVALRTAMTDQLTWSGAEGARQNNGIQPKMYAPARFEAGSSVSHIDEGTYASSLMTPFIAEGEGQTSIPAMTQAMFTDFGWGVEARTPSEALVTAAVRDFVKRFPTPTELATLAGRLDAGTLTQQQLVRSLALSDEWVGAIVDGYYISTLGRPADATGKAHWSDLLRSGATSADVVSNFYASSEYFRRAGGTNRAWIRSLYQLILDREPDPPGWDAWVASADAGRSRPSIAREFFQSREPRMKRVRGLYDVLLGRAPETAGLLHWTEVLRNGRDLDLAIELASSVEYRRRTFARFG